MFPFQTSQPTVETFEQELSKQPTIYHPSRTAKSLYSHWLLMKQYHLLPDQSGNRPVAQIPQCTSPISHNASFCNRNVHMCAHFCVKMVHCGIFVKCIVGLWLVAASWSSGRVQDSGLGSRSKPEFNTLPMRLLVLPLSKALHAALLLSTQEEMGTCEGRFVSRGAKLRVSGCILPRELRWLSRRIWTVKGPMTREGTCQSLQSRALSLDVDSKQWLYLYLWVSWWVEIFLYLLVMLNFDVRYLL